MIAWWPSSPLRLYHPGARGSWSTNSQDPRSGIFRMRREVMSITARTAKGNYRIIQISVGTKHCQVWTQPHLHVEDNVEERRTVSHYAEGIVWTQCGQSSQEQGEFHFQAHLVHPALGQKTLLRPHEGYWESIGNRLSQNASTQGNHRIDSDIQVWKGLWYTQTQGLGLNKIAACPAEEPKLRKGDFLGPRGLDWGEWPHQSHRPKPALPPFLLHALKPLTKSQEGNNRPRRRHVPRIRVIPPTNNRRRPEYLREEVMIFYELRVSASLHSS